MAALLATLALGAGGASAQAAPVLSVTGGAAPEGTGTTPTQATFTVHSTEPAPAGGITVLFQMQNAGTGATVATAGQDYMVPASNSVTIPAGADQATIPVNVVADAVDEPDQLFALRLTTVTSGGASVDPNANVGTWTIQDDDPPPTISVADGYEGPSASSPLTEGTGANRSMTFEVTLSSVSEKDIRIDYDTIAGTAKPQVTPGDDGDYQAPPAGHAPLTIPAGSTLGKIFVTIIADARDETDETFTLRLSNPINATTFTRSQAVGKIIDDDGPSASIVDGSVTEGPSGSTTGVDLTVLLSQASPQDVSFTYTTADGTATAPDDYDAVNTPQTVVIPAGSLAATIHLTVRGDDIDEGDEQFSVKLGTTPTSNATLADGTATVTIRDDDPPPALSVGDVSVPEGTGGTTTAAVTIQLAGPAARKLTIGYATQDGTATGGLDYQPTSGTVDIAAGATSATVRIPIAADAELEPNETFFLRAFHTTTDGSGQVVPDPSQPSATGTVTIIDDDLSAQNTPTLSVTGGRVQEGDSGTRPVTFTVRLDAPSPRPVTVHYATSGGTATPGIDYTPVDGTLTFAPGETSKTISVDVLGDRVPERNETIGLVLDSPVNARTGPAPGVATIIDDDVGGGPIVLPRGRVALTSLLCASRRGCRGLPVRWTVQRPGTVEVRITARVPRGAGAARRRAATRTVTLVRQTLQARRPGPGSGHVRRAPGRTTAQLLRLLRGAHVRSIQVTATFTNREGARQAPVRATLGLRGR